jgi:RNA polymerase sigma-70 factor (ECF subfamily)
MAVAPSDANSRSTERTQATANETSGTDAPGLAADVALAAAGDRSAFERVYRAHCDRVFSVCVRMTSDAAQAEELTQDTFVRAWTKMGQFRGESSFATWLHRLAVNVVLNAHKGDGRKKRTISMTEDEGDEEAGSVGATLMAPSHFAPGEWMDIEEAIASLPPGAKRVFVLHDVEGYRHEEIGTMLGITSGGSKAQLHRARMLLREALDR